MDTTPCSWQAGENALNWYPDDVPSRRTESSEPTSQQNRNLSPVDTLYRQPDFTSSQEPVPVARRLTSVDGSLVGVPVGLGDWGTQPHQA